MGILKQYLQRALADTLSFLDWSPKQIVWPILVLVGFFFSSFWVETEQDSIEKALKFEILIYVVRTLVPVCGFAFLMFCWNLACAPFRIERDAHNITKKKLSSSDGVSLSENLRRFVENRDYFTLKETACLIAGTEISEGSLTGVAAGYLYDIKKQISDRSIPTLKTAKAMGTLAIFASQIDGDYDNIPSHTQISKSTLGTLSTEYDTIIPSITDEDV